jgi:hypothetical protein
VGAIDTWGMSAFKMNYVVSTFGGFILDDNGMPIDGKPLVRLPDRNVYILGRKQPSWIYYRLFFKHAEEWRD